MKSYELWFGISHGIIRLILRIIMNDLEIIWCWVGYIMYNRRMYRENDQGIKARGVEEGKRQIDCTNHYRGNKMYNRIVYREKD